MKGTNCKILPLLDILFFISINTSLITRILNTHPTSGFHCKYSLSAYPKIQHATHIPTLSSLLPFLPTLPYPKLPPSSYLTYPVPPLPACRSHQSADKAIDLSRPPTPTNPTALYTLSDAETASTTNTKYSLAFEDNNDDNYITYVHRSELFGELVDELIDITTASFDESVGTNPESLRRYYARKWEEVAEKEEYNVSLTTPPCPYIILTAVDKFRYRDVRCPCCLPDELPRLRVNAGAVGGGVVTLRVVVEEMRKWLYGEDCEDQVGDDGGLEAVMDGLEAGEAGLLGWNCMASPEADDIMGLKLFLYFGKPLVGGGFYESPSLEDED
ncbi:hypothetical protein ABW19_dt0206437 [Dactylella cylindrospora]|nr:hypothetical protein ABW19_dt0206437 [Dactylella cylindrospora]